MIWHSNRDLSVCKERFFPLILFPHWRIPSSIKGKTTVTDKACLMSILRGRPFSNFGTNLFLCTLPCSFRNFVKLAIFHPWDFEKDKQKPASFGWCFWWNFKAGEQQKMPTTTTKNANNNNNNKIGIFGFFCWTFIFVRFVFGFYLERYLPRVFCCWPFPPGKVGRVSGHLRWIERFRLGLRQGVAVFPFPIKSMEIFPMGKYHPNFWGWGKHTSIFFLKNGCVFFLHWRGSFLGRHEYGCY